MSARQTPLQLERAKYLPKLPPVFAQGAAAKSQDGAVTWPTVDRAALQALFPKTCGLPLAEFAPASGASALPARKVGVILSGGQAAGGHNVIAGLFDGLRSLNANCQLVGFLGGPIGLIKNKSRELTAEFIADYRNTGGFDIIGSGRDKIEKPEEFAAALKTCQAHGLSALVVIGGDDSNTNACVLAEYFLSVNAGIQVIGCPKTIDGDLKNEWIETSFGFDTACKVYSELIGNIGRDSLSAKKYWHFIKLMGRSASHIALECALQTQPNLTLISEEVAAKQQTLREVIEEVTQVIVKRAEKGWNFGLVLIPEGLIEFIPEFKKLISTLNDLLSKAGAEPTLFANASETGTLVALGLSPAAADLYLSLPDKIRRQLVMDRDPHGNVQVSRINTEELVIEMVERRLKALAKAGTYTGKFNAINHFFGYEGRCAAPSNFDADYCYGLGYTAAALIGAGRTGYLACLRGLVQPASQWRACGIPLTSMMNLERRHGSEKPVIKKALVDLKGKPFSAFASQRADWAVSNDFVSPGPIQYFGPAAVCDQITQTLHLEQG